MQLSLILVTSTFPYGKGETFLETEIEYLCQYFSKVVVLPTKKVNIQEKRKIPQNCFVELSLVSKKTNHIYLFSILSKIYHTLTFPAFWIEVKNLWPNRINISSLNRLFFESKIASLTAKAVNKICDKFKFDSKNTIVYTYWFGGATLGSILIDKPLKVITRAHRSDLYDFLYPHNYIPYRKYSIEKVDKILLISKNGLDYLKKKFPSSKSKFELFRLGIKIPENLSVIKPSENEITIVSCSSVSKVKRVTLIAKLLRKYSLSHENKINWHHFGDGPLQIELQDFIKDVPQNLSIKLHGFKKNEAVLDWYKKYGADLLINLSTNEGIPVSIMEANSFKIPSLATNVGGTSELVSDSTGWLIQDPSSMDDMFETLELALSNKNELKRKGNNAREMCAYLFNADINYKKSTQFLKFMIANSKSSNA